jgi:hypothetical protein
MMFSGLARRCAFGGKGNADKTELTGEKSTPKEILFSGKIRLLVCGLHKRSKIRISFVGLGRWSPYDGSIN